MPRRTFAEALFFGFKDYVDELPPTSPARKILLKIALEHADVKSVSHYFEFSETTVRKANCEEDDFIKAMKSRPGITRKRIYTSDEEVLEEFMNEYIPVVSGRSFRVQTVTDLQLYIDYLFFCWARDVPPFIY